MGMGIGGLQRSVQAPKIQINYSISLLHRQFLSQGKPMSLILRLLLTVAG